MLTQDSSFNWKLLPNSNTKPKFRAVLKHFTSIRQNAKFLIRALKLVQCCSIKNRGKTKNQLKPLSNVLKIYRFVNLIMLFLAKLLRFKILFFHYFHGWWHNKITPDYPSFRITGWVMESCFCPWCERWVISLPLLLTPSPITHTYPSWPVFHRFMVNCTVYTRV